MTTKQFFRVSYFDAIKGRRVEQEKGWEKKSDAEIIKKRLEAKHECKHTRDRVTHMSDYKVEPVTAIFF